ncbi:low molecular weight phosphatase family protein [Robertkochia solimangrovi]|uniref:arsenate-mycothiol transferase ArsC n=1 Tax=Robertkochia solimangrovi TaxID=2213046 RepID=UPI001181316E|nr:low molecular weight phosphatase family protein [Robertkochia solimangrovi]TRZ46448.1 low molecular weight phosphatase family protein [Robertkochia solimangrovi]
MNQHILFLCTGNYYRSRFAEILFNHISRIDNLPYRADSRGLRISPRNKGPLSIHTIEYMKSLNIDIVPFLRDPSPVDVSDFTSYSGIIAMDRKEHEPMMKELFPDYYSKIEYWDFEDDYITAPEIVLPRLEKKIRLLVEQFKLK